MKYYLHWEAEGVNTFYRHSDREEYNIEEDARKRVEELKICYREEDRYKFYYSLIHGTRLEYK